MDSLRGHASIEHEKTYLEAGANLDSNDRGKSENAPELTKEPSFSSSSSSDTSSDEDFFQIDTSYGGKPNAVKDEKALQIGGNSRLEEPTVELTAKPNLESDNFVKFESNQPPASQSTGKYNVPDPNRIPASIFTSTKGSTPMEWSVTSNESLFSIHIGKSGDLTSFCNSNLDYFSPVTPLTGPSPVKEVDSGPVLKQPEAAEKAKAGTMKAAADGNAVKENPAILEIPHSNSTSSISDGSVLMATAEEYGAKEKPSISGTLHSDSTSRFSEGSVTSYRSFAFPILTMEGRSGSQKNESSVHPRAQTEQPQQSPPSTEPPISGGRKWFPCFSCCPFCC